MHKRNIALSTLIPANDRLFQYYGHLGYAAVFSYSTTSYAVPPAQAMPSGPFFSPEHFDAEFARQHYPFFRDTLMQKNCCVQHTEEDYLAIVEETYLSGGRLLVCASEDRQSTTGWALPFAAGTSHPFARAFLHFSRPFGYLPAIPRPIRSKPLRYGQNYRRTVYAEPLGSTKSGLILKTESLRSATSRQQWHFYACSR